MSEKRMNIYNNKRVNLVTEEMVYSELKLQLTI